MCCASTDLICLSQPTAVGLESFEKEQATPARRQYGHQALPGVFTAHPVPRSSGSSDRSPANVGGAASFGFPSGDMRGSIPGLRASASGPTNPNAAVSTGQSVAKKGSAGTGKGLRRWPRVFVVNPRDAEDVSLRSKPSRDAPEVRRWVIASRAWACFYCCKECIRVSTSSRTISNRGRANVSVRQCETRENEPHGPLPPNYFDRSVGREGVG